MTTTGRWVNRPLHSFPWEQTILPSKSHLLWPEGKVQDICHSKATDVAERSRRAAWELSMWWCGEKSGHNQHVLLQFCRHCSQLSWPTNKMKFNSAFSSLIPGESPCGTFYVDRVGTWKKGHANRLLLLHKDNPNPLSLFISHKMSILTGLYSLILSPNKKHFKRHQSTETATGVLYWALPTHTGLRHLK